MFNNNGKSAASVLCQDDKCIVCINKIQDKTGFVTSNVTGLKHDVNQSLTCQNGGIYVINGVCSEQYTGKTVNFGARSKEHFSTSKLSVIHSHKQNCNLCSSTSDFNIKFVESYLQRGKFSLSEREFLWNGRIKGSMNVQKTLKA